MYWLRNPGYLLRSTLFKPHATKTRIPNGRPYGKKMIDEDDRPIKYSLSPASRWKARETRTGVVRDRLWYEPYVLLGSISALLVYFCVLREENDLDLELQKSLYARIEGLEEHQLRVLLDYNRRHGLETDEIVRRLGELESLRAQVM